MFYRVNKKILCCNITVNNESTISYSLVLVCSEMTDNGFKESRPLRYDTIAEFNVDSKAECDQLNLAGVVVNNSRLPYTLDCCVVPLRNDKLRLFSKRRPLSSHLHVEYRYSPVSRPMKQVCLLLYF